MYSLVFAFAAGLLSPPSPTPDAGGIKCEATQVRQDADGERATVIAIRFKCPGVSAASDLIISYEQADPPVQAPSAARPSPARR